jgi:hypothetical protein
LDVSKLGDYLKGAQSSSQGYKFQPRTNDGRYTFTDLKRRIISEGVTAIMGKDVSGYIPSVNNIGKNPPTSQMGYNPGFGNYNNTVYNSRPFSSGSNSNVRPTSLNGSNIVSILKGMNDNVLGSLNNISTVLNRIQVNIDHSNSLFTNSFNSLGQQMNKSNQFLSIIASSAVSDRYRKDVGTTNYSSSIPFNDNKKTQQNNNQEQKAAPGLLSSAMDLGEDGLKVGGALLLGKYLKNKAAGALGALGGVAKSTGSVLGSTANKLFPHFGMIANKALPLTTRFGASLPLLGDILQGYSSYKESGSIGRGIAGALGSLGGRTAFGFAGGLAGPAGAIAAQIPGSFVGSGLGNYAYDKLMGTRRIEDAHVAKRQIEQKKAEVRQQDNLQKIELKANELIIKGQTIKFEAQQINFGNAQLGGGFMGMGSGGVAYGGTRQRNRMVGDMARRGSIGGGGSTQFGEVPYPQIPGGAIQPPSVPGVNRSTGRIGEIQQPQIPGVQNYPNQPPSVPGVNGSTGGGLPRSGPTVQMPSQRGGVSSGGAVPGLSSPIPGTTKGQGAYRTFDSKAAGLMKEIMERYKVSKETAAAVVGNLGHESTGFTAMQEGNPTSGRGGWGWAQWTGRRRRAFEHWAAENKLDPSSDAANKGFLFHEIDNQYKEHLQNIDKRGGSIADRTRAWEHKFEVSGDYNQATGEILKPKHDQSRINYANRAAGLYDGSISPVAPSKASSAVDKATSMLGAHENINRESIMKYLKDGGRDLDPLQRAWCAAFVGASLQQAGIPNLSKEQGGELASSWNNWGAQAEGAIQRGDVLIDNSRYNPETRQGSHVGFATGNTKKDKQGNLLYEMISGNYNDKVGTSWERASKMNARRWIDPQPQEQPQSQNNQNGSSLPMFARGTGVPFTDADWERGPKDIINATRNAKLNTNGWPESKNIEDRRGENQSYIGASLRSMKEVITRPQNNPNMDIVNESENRAIAKEKKSAPMPMMVNMQSSPGKIMPAEGDNKYQDVKINEPDKHQLDSKRITFADYYK